MLWLLTMLCTDCRFSVRSLKTAYFPLHLVELNVISDVTMVTPVRLLSRRRFLLRLARATREYLPQRNSHPTRLPWH